jgi:hypothetical protein
MAKALCNIQTKWFSEILGFRTLSIVLVIKNTVKNSKKNSIYYFFYYFLLCF